MTNDEKKEKINKELSFFDEVLNDIIDTANKNSVSTAIGAIALGTSITFGATGAAIATTTIISTVVIFLVATIIIITLLVIFTIFTVGILLFFIFLAYIKHKKRWYLGPLAWLPL